MNTVLGFIYFEYSILIFGFIMAFRFVIKRGSSLFKYEKIVKNQKGFINKEYKKINLIFKITIIVIMVIALFRIVPLTLDIPYAVTGRTESIMVKVIKNDLGNPGKMKQRDIVVENVRNGKQFSIHVWGYAIERGDVLIVEILPFSKFGTIIELVN